MAAASRFNVPPRAKLTSPGVPKTVINPLTINANKAPNANPLNACDRTCAVEGNQ